MSNVAEGGISNIAVTMLETRYGQFSSSLFRANSGEECLMFCTRGMGEGGGTPTVRIHSSCLFDESFYSRECDCREQLDAALTEVAETGGTIVYSFQEGRGIGLCGKILAMEIERVQGVNTAEAFAKLGYGRDVRTYDTAIQALMTTRVGRKLRVISNNPFKLRALQDAGYEIVERVEPPLRLYRRAISLVRIKQRVLEHIPYNNLVLIDEGG